MGKTTLYRILAAGTFGDTPAFKYRHGEPDNPVHVDADELDAANILARQRYEAKLAECVTTFYLGPKLDEERAGTFTAADGVHIDGRKAQEAMRRMPFPVVRIVQTVMPPPGDPIGPMESEVICFGDGKVFGWMARDHQINSGVTAYSPNGLSEIDGSLPMAYLYLMEALSSGRTRGIEKPVSRQVRRRSGFASDYKEFIVIRKPSKEQRKTALRLSDIMRRIPRLHAVRGHIVRYRAERYTFMRNKVGWKKAHPRGAGKMLQVRDYYAEDSDATPA